MSKQDAVPQAPSDTAVLEPGGSLHQDSAGAVLRDARQSQGLDIATLAALLKVPVHKLQALEQDRFELLPDSVFARALASSVCRVLKLDPAPVLQRLPAIAAFGVTSQNRGINAPFRTRSGRHAAPFWRHISKPALLVGLALLLAALVLVFLPSIQQEIARYRQDAGGVAAQGQVDEPVAVTTTTVTAAVGTSGAASSPSLQALPPAEVPGFVSTPAPPPNAPLAPSTATAATASADATVTFSAKGQARIKVTDANGALVLDRALRAGESVGASGALPLVAVVNRASAVQVQVRGQAFELDGVTRNNIARFEVK